MLAYSLTQNSSSLLKSKMLTAENGFWENVSDAKVAHFRPLMAPWHLNGMMNIYVMSSELPYLPMKS